MHCRCPHYVRQIRQDAKLKPSCTTVTTYTSCGTPSASPELTFFPVFLIFSSTVA